MGADDQSHVVALSLLVMCGWVCVLVNMFEYFSDRFMYDSCKWQPVRASGREEGQHGSSLVSRDVHVFDLACLRRYTWSHLFVSL